MSLLALDTSVAVPLLVQTHSAHAAVVDWWSGRTVTLSGHAVAETYSVLTRLPGDVRLTPADAAHLLRVRFESPLHPRARTLAALPKLLSEHGIAGGAVYDALVGLAARDHGAELVTRDARAKATYEAIGVRVVAVGA